MSISAAQFVQWVKDQASNVTVLAEVKFGYQNAGVPAEGTFYLADRKYVTGPTDSPANTRYRDVSAAAPSFPRSIDLATLGSGRAPVGSSSAALALNNADGALDFILDTIVDGRDVSFYVGDKDWPRSEFRLVNVATIAAVKADDDTKITLALRERKYLLDATIVGAAIATGPNAGKPKPVIIGSVLQVDLSGYLYDTAGPTYYFNDFAQDSFANVVDVRDAGISLAKTGFSGDNSQIAGDAGTDTILTIFNHGLAVNDVVYMFGTTPMAGLSINTQYWVIAAGLTATDFRVSLTRGGVQVDITGATFVGTLTFRVRRWYVDAATASLTLSSNPSGRVTADIDGTSTSGAGQLAIYPHKAFQFIATTYTRAMAADLDVTTLDAMGGTEAAQTLKWGHAVLDRENVLTLLDEIALCTNSWYGQNSAGIITAGQLDLSNLDTAAAIDSVVQGDFIAQPSCENLPLPFGRVNWDYKRNVVQQSDGLAAGVTTTNRAAYALPYRGRVISTDPFGTDYPNDWWNYHKSAIDSPPVPSSLNASSVVADVQAAGRRDLFKPWTRVLRGTVGLDKYALNPGDCVLVTYPRYGLSSGKNFRVISVNTRISDRKVDLVLARQTTPDYTSAAHV